MITIPVVFHVLYANSTENIADSEILEQLQTLNDDFRRLNSDADGIWPQAADTEIEFCLASFDPAAPQPMAYCGCPPPSRVLDLTTP